MARNMNLTSNKYDEPRRFTGEFWAILDDYYPKATGYIGYIGVGTDDTSNLIRRFYN